MHKHFTNSTYAYVHSCIHTYVNDIICICHYLHLIVRITHTGLQDVLSLLYPGVIMYKYRHTQNKSTCIYIHIYICTSIYSYINTPQLHSCAQNEYVYSYIYMYTYTHIHLHIHTYVYSSNTHAPFVHKTNK